MAWILQGNPNRFDIDDYLTRYSYIYWSVSTNRKDFAVGDKVFIWRAGEKSGAVALGSVKELPVPRCDVKKPEALGDDLWVSRQDEPSEIKVGIEIEEVKLTPEEGMLERKLLKTHSIMSRNRIITKPVGTVFRLSSEEEQVLSNLWKAEYSDESNIIFSATEGTRQLKAHLYRERSRKLISQKKEQYKKLNGLLRCEICGLSFAKIYPISLGEDFIEVHHKTPLSQIESVVRTTLDDLLLVCANCHRMIHRTKDCEQNLELLLNHFRTAKYNLIPDTSTHDT
jgi:5-methylcytosine-specific restriction endonuclease McrA